MPVDAHEVFELRPSRAAPAQARRALRIVAEQFPSDLTDTAELLTSELVTNAVTHGAGLVTLKIDCETSTLAVAVGDDDPGPPEIQPERLLSLGGRGLRMVDTLAGSWGITAREDGPGKIVWFRLP